MDSDMALTELQEHELPEAVVEEDEDDVEELRNSLREVVQDQSVKPKLQCLMVDPSFSMVTVQSEDSGIVWETASSRCSTPWASEASYSSDTYSLDGSATGGGGAQGKITIVFDEDKIVRRRKRTRGKARLGERLRRPGSSRSGSALGVERPEMAEVSVPNIRVESVESDTESGEVKDKEQELFSLISEGYEILNIKVPSKLPTVDEEESTELQDNLSYLEETPRIRSKSRRGSEALPAQDYPEMKEVQEGTEGVGESKPSEPTEQQGPHSHKDGTSNMDYFEAFTLLDEVVPGQQVPEPVGDEAPVKPQREEPNLGQMTATDSLSAAPDDDFVFVTDMEIASERLDEVFYGNKHHAPPEDLMKRGEEEEEGGKEGRRESLRSLKESGSALFGREESILTPIFLSPGPPKIIDPILLEEPTAMSFLYSDLYEDAMGERRRSDEEGSEAESVGSDRSFQRRLSDSEETDGYLEKFILKDETPNVEDQSEEVDGKGEGLMMWSQSKFELTGFLTRVVEEEEEDEKEECKEEIKAAEMNGYLQPARYKEMEQSTEMEESTEKSLLHIKETGPDKDSESVNTDRKVSQVEKDHLVTGKKPEKVDVVEEAKSETTPEAHESEVDSQEEVVSDKVSHETELLAQAEEVKKLDEVEVSRVAKPVVIQEPVVVQVNQVTTESKTETVVKASEPVRAEDAIKDPTEAIAGAQELHRVFHKAVTDLSVDIVKVSDDTKMASEIAAEAINRMEMLAEANKVEKVENRSEEPVSVAEESFKHNPEPEVVPTAPPAEAAARWSSPLAPAEGDKGQEEEPMKKQDLEGEDEWVFTPLRSFAPQEDLSELHRETVVSEIELHTDAGFTERVLHRETAEELEYEIISQQEAREMMVSETERKQLCPGPNSNLERERELEKEKEKEMELERERKKQRLKEEERQERGRQEREEKERQEKEKQMGLERERERLRLKKAKERQETEDKEKKEKEERERERQRLKEVKKTQERERQERGEKERQEREDKEKQMECLREEERQEREQKERQEREGKEIQERERESNNQRLKEKERQERKSEMELVLEGEKQKERVRENLLMDMERQKEREMEERVREERGLDLPAYEEPIEADYEIFDAEEESQARAAAALQGMDCFCLGCGCLLSETDRLSGGHQDHEVTSVETAYEDIRERLSEWISELQERSENIEDLVSELELGYNTVEDHCRDSEEVMEAQNEEMMALVMEQYNTMSLSMEEEKKAKLEQLYDQIVSFQESIDQAKVTLDTTAREAEIDPDTQTSKDIYMRLTEALQSAMSLELGPRGLLVFEDYAKGNAVNTHTRRKGIPVPQKPSLQPQECASASSTSVTVYWRVNPGDIIDCFQVYCMEDPQGAVSDEYRVTVKESYCVLEELEPDKVYKVWVMAVNYTGCSLPSERLPFRTAPSVPVIDTGRCTILWDSATLRWNVDNQTPTQSYTLEYCRQYALEGEGLRSISGIQGRQQRVLLHPNENYLFYIKAVNKAGASEQSEAALISTRGTRFHLLKASAHPVLKLSEDQTTLYYPQDTYTERGDVVNECPSVLGELLPMRGHHYWETNVTRSPAYRVGVAYETANRDSLLGENSTSWCLHCVPTPYSCRFELLHGSVQSDVFVGEVPSHIGTLLDYKHGRLSFYDTQRGQLLGTLAHCFTQPCHPVLGMEQPGSLKVSMALEVADFAKHS
ncbi:cardiomyopathy-associated protein 5 [Salmo salar]|uniref:Cardiomyopathy-associated protein 5 n=1 Tax=Salmo salar TaxID=8030 RepID=A0ABM3E1W9_SALSA|nr:cardiomyopathy-associated protein 5 [Salmo salar]